MDLETLLSSPDPKRFTAGGRDVGRRLATEPVRRLGELWRSIDGVQRNTSVDEYRKGFLDALEMVVSAFSAEREHADTLERDLQTIRSRRHWLSVLRALDEGVANPQALATHLELSVPSISKLLADMELAALIERLDLPSNDARAKPRRLTLRARVVLQRLGKDEAVAPVKSIVAAVTACLPALIENGREHHQELLTQFGGALGEELAEPAVALFIESLFRRGLVSVEKDGSILAVAADVAKSLEECLQEALRSNRKITWLCERLVPLYVRTQRDEWDVLVRRSSDLARVRIVRDDDLTWGRNFPFTGEYEVLYESPAQARRDLERGDGKGFAAEARQRLVLAPSLDDFVPESCVRVGLTEVFSRSA